MPRFVTRIPAREYDLAATLTSGQAFRWKPQDGAWTGVIGGRWVRLRQAARGTETPNTKLQTPTESRSDTIVAETAERLDGATWLTHYLQSDLELSEVLATFPDDEPMRRALGACRGLRLLSQDPWECLASFILSSTKQIVQIQQIVGLVCERFGEPVAVPGGEARAHAFPPAERIAAATEAELRACKMGFRAPYLLGTALAVASGEFDLEQVRQLPVAEARERLCSLPGVGRKIADCVLLFAYGFPTAFPIDVWVMKALRQLYFPRRRPTRQRLERFSEEYFGCHAGYAQQYLFHYMRTAWTPEKNGSAPGHGSRREREIATGIAEP